MHYGRAWGPARDTLGAAQLAAAERVLARYTPERLGKVWAILLTTPGDRQEPGERRQPSGEASC